jgi:hypothetical protein
VIGRLMRRRRDAETARVEAFLVAIRTSRPEPATEPIPLPVYVPVPLPRVELVDGPHGPVWRLDEATAARLRTNTRELPRIVAVASASLR